MAEVLAEKKVSYSLSPFIAIMSFFFTHRVCRRCLKAFQSLILTLARLWRLHILGCAWVAYYGNQLSPLPLSLSLYGGNGWYQWRIGRNLDTGKTKVTCYCVVFVSICMFVCIVCLSL